MPTDGGSPAASYRGRALKCPSRGLSQTMGAVPEPVTSRSTARSLLISESTTLVVAPSPDKPVSDVQLVNVPLPLLRHSTFNPTRAKSALVGDPGTLLLLGGCAAPGWPVTNKSRSPS